jgi:hypothetical protein
LRHRTGGHRAADATCAWWGHGLACPVACAGPDIIDADGDDEPQTAFLEVFNQDVPLPISATVLGMPVEVVGFDYRDERRGVVARCRRDGSRQDLAVVDLILQPDTVAAWVQAAYRRWLGLDPNPYDMPAGWRPSWL